MIEIPTSEQEQEKVYIDSQGEKYYVLAAPDSVIEEIKQRTRNRFGYPEDYDPIQHSPEKLNNNIEKSEI